MAFVPKHCGMPPLNLNIELLRSHAMLVSMFVTSSEPDISIEKRRWRSWLVHCLVKSARHYDEARALILAQLEESQRSPEEMTKGRLLPMLDFAFAMEDCITSLEKAVACIRALTSKDKIQSTNVLVLREEGLSLNAFRRQQEHMHSQIAAGQTGDGPILVSLSDDSDGMILRDLSMPFSALHRLIEATYHDIAKLFPAYKEPSSQIMVGGGMPQLTISMTIKTVPRSE